MGYVDTSHAEASAIPQATAAATYFIFGPSGSNAFGATDQSLTATPTSVAATGGPAGASRSDANQALSPGSVLPDQGMSAQTILLIAVASVAAALLARRFS